MEKEQDENDNGQRSLQEESDNLPCQKREEESTKSVSAVMPFQEPSGNEQSPKSNVKTVLHGVDTDEQSSEKQVGCETKAQQKSAFEESLQKPKYGIEENLPKTESNLEENRPNQKPVIEGSLQKQKSAFQEDQKEQKINIEDKQAETEENPQKHEQNPEKQETAVKLIEETALQQSLQKQSETCSQHADTSITQQDLHKETKDLIRNKKDNDNEKETQKQTEIIIATSDNKATSQQQQSKIVIKATDSNNYEICPQKRTEIVIRSTNNFATSQQQQSKVDIDGKDINYEYCEPSQTEIIIRPTTIHRNENVQQGETETAVANNSHGETPENQTEIIIRNNSVLNSEVPQAQINIIIGSTNAHSSQKETRNEEVVNERDKAGTDTFEVPITLGRVDFLRNEFYSNSHCVMAQNACTREDSDKLCIDWAAFSGRSHTFNKKREKDTDPRSDQKDSGTCWIHATLNLIRPEFIKQFNLEKFEFSQAFLMFYAKVERSYWYLIRNVENYRNGEVLLGRVMRYTLGCPESDGGNWHTVFSLILKYGLMPKECFSWSTSADNSNKLNESLSSLLKGIIKELFDMVDSGATPAELHKKILEEMKKVYVIIGIHLGIPAETFTWEYYDKDKSYRSIGPITPKAFYEQYVKPLYNIENKIRLVCNSHPLYSFGQQYLTENWNYVIGGLQPLANNQPMDLLIDLASKSIEEGEPVWCCYMCTRHIRGFMDIDMFNPDLLFGITSKTLSREDKFVLGEFGANHAAALVGVKVEDDGKPVRWRIENSWGDSGEKGFLSVSSEWFRENAYGIVIDKRFVPPEVMDVFQQTPNIVPHHLGL